MTRQEFIDSVNSFYDLICFCQDECIYDLLDDIYDADYLNEIIIDSIREMRDWEQVRDFVNGIPAGCEYYREDGYGGFEDALPFLNDYKDDAIRHMDNNDLWDEEEDEDLDEEMDDEDEEPNEYIEAPVKIEEEDIEITSFMAVLGRAS